MNLPGGEERWIFGVYNDRAPGGERVAFYYETEGMTPPVKFCLPPYSCITLVPSRPEQQWKLGMVELLTSHFSQPPCGRHSFSPAWLPDGKKIAFLSDRDGPWHLYVMDADGSDQQQILERGDRPSPHPLWFRPGEGHLLDEVK